MNFASVLLIRRPICFFAAFSCLVLGLLPSDVYAQPRGQNSFQGTMEAINASTLSYGQETVFLWGIERIAIATPALELQARTILNNVIAGRTVRCDLKGRSNNNNYAQCLNYADVDLALYMIQQGYATANREVILGTVFEDVYISAETRAQELHRGVWAFNQIAGSAGGSGFSALGTLALIILTAAGLGLLGFYFVIVKRLNSIDDKLGRQIDMAQQAKKLREKEKEIVSILLETEIKANKAKIEAYLVVYEEMLQTLSNPERAPKYTNAGDIVQKQPVLDGSVYKHNADKLDILEPALAQKLITFYSKISSNPEYQDLEPDTPREEAVAIVHSAVNEAKKLNKMAGELLEDFALQEDSSIGANR